MLKIELERRIKQIAFEIKCDLKNSSLWFLNSDKPLVIIDNIILFYERNAIAKGTLLEFVVKKRIQPNKKLIDEYRSWLEKVESEDPETFISGEVWEAMDEEINQRQKIIDIELIEFDNKVKSL